MKKFFYFALLTFLTVSVIGCGKDDSNDLPPYGYNPMKGEWQSEDAPTSRYAFNSFFQISKGTYNNETGEWSYRRVAARYYTDYTSMTVTDSVNGFRVNLGTWEYKITSQKETENKEIKTMSVRQTKNADGDNIQTEWTRYRKQVCN